MTPSCSTCRSFTTSPAPSCSQPAKPAGSRKRAVEMGAEQQVLPLDGFVSEAARRYRADHLLVAEMVERGSRVLDVGCGDGDLLQLLESRGIDGRGIELSR